jgi:hypothetical protein
VVAVLRWLMSTSTRGVKAYCWNTLRFSRNDWLVSAAPAT